MSITREQEQIEIVSKDDEVILVSLRTLLISPIFQDVFYFEASGSKKNEAGDGPNSAVKLPIDFSANAIRTFFGLLEGRNIHEIVYSNGTDEIKVDCVASLTDALALGDKYDIPFFPGIWKSAIRELAKQGGDNALLAFGAAYCAGDRPLAKAVISQCKGISNPLRFSASKVEWMGWKSWLQIIRAWDLYTSTEDEGILFNENYHWVALTKHLFIWEEVSLEAPDT